MVLVFTHEVISVDNFYSQFALELKIVNKNFQIFMKNG